MLTRILFVLVCLSLMPVLSFGGVLTFESVDLGTATPFTTTADGITATFRSPDGPVFFVCRSIFSSLQGQIVCDFDPAAHVLEIAFSQPLDFISMNFALTAPGGSFFTLDASNGGAHIAETQVYAGPPPKSVYAEGTIGFSGQVFDSVQLSATSAHDFAIDNVTIHAASAVPEPSTFGMAIVTIGGLLAARRKLHS